MLASDLNADRAALRELNRVAAEVEQNLLYAACITRDHLRQPWVQQHIQSQTLGLGLRGQQLTDVFSAVTRVEILGLEFEATGLHP